MNKVAVNRLTTLENTMCGCGHVRDLCMIKRSEVNKVAVNGLFTNRCSKQLMDW